MIFIPYKGKGIFVLLSFIVGFFISIGICRVLNITNNGVISIIGWGISALLCVLIEVFLGKEIANQRLPKFNSKIDIKNIAFDHVFYLPIRYWKFIYLGLAIITVLFVLLV